MWHERRESQHSGAGERGERGPLWGVNFFILHSDFYVKNWRKWGRQCRRSCALPPVVARAKEVGVAGGTGAGGVACGMPSFVGWKLSVRWTFACHSVDWFAYDFVCSPGQQRQQRQRQQRQQQQQGQVKRNFILAPNDVDADADANVDSGSCCLCADVDAGRDVAVVTLWFVCHFRFAFACRASTKVRERKREREVGPL